MNISFAITTRQVRDRIKTETRRNGWKKLVAQCQHCQGHGWLNPPYQRPHQCALCKGTGKNILHGIEKGQGLKPGEHPRLITCVNVVAVRREPLDWITADAVVREGFPGQDPAWFIRMYCDHNGGEPAQEVTVIQFTYPWRVNHVGAQRLYVVWANSEHDACCSACILFHLPAPNLYITPFTDELKPLVASVPSVL